jgi:hypothetical protein
MKQFCIMVILIFATFATHAESASDKWVEQKVKTNHLYFSVQFSLVDTDLSGPNAPTAIKVIENDSNKVVQEISIKEAYPVNFLDDDKRIGLSDINFDGYLDIELMISTGGNTPNDVTTFYVYNPKTRQFKHDKKLTFVQVRVDERKKTITSSWVGDYCKIGTDTYKFIKGKLTLIESIVDNCNFRLIKRRLKNGKMETTKERTHLAG